jgi:hypothetical protein
MMITVGGAADEHASDDSGTEAMKTMPKRREFLISMSPRQSESSTPFASPNDVSLGMVPPARENQAAALTFASDGIPALTTEPLFARCTASRVSTGAPGNALDY